MREHVEEASGGASQPRPAENFPIALRVLPGRTRRHLGALYRYARHVDDLGDEPRPGLSRAGRLAQLDQIEAAVADVFAGRAVAEPAVRGLLPVVRECGLPLEPLLRLIESNRIDQRVNRYETFDQLVDYCRYSANPVGELVLSVFGQATSYQVALSDRICTALQLIEHLQDIGEDYRRDRVYLPAEDRTRFRVSELELAADAASVRLRTLITFQAERASAWLDSGAPLAASLRGWARPAVHGYVAGGRAALRELARRGYDPLPAVPKPRRRQVLWRWFTATAWSAG